MVTRRDAVNSRKNEIARRIEEALADLGAVRCDDDTRVVKVGTRIHIESWNCEEIIELEIYIKEIQ